MKPQRKAIFLDRDGVLNKAIIKDGKPFSPVTLSELVIEEDARAILQELREAGFMLIGATNQPDVARGLTEKSTVDAINKKLLNELNLDVIRVCFHDDKDQCACRKPLPGLILDAAKSYDIDLSKSFMIGDRWKDVAAGRSAGCKTIWINYGYDEKYTAEQPDFTAKNLAEAKDWIIGKKY